MMVQRNDASGTVCRYPGAFLDCRGPIRPLTQPYVAVYDGTPVLDDDLSTPLAAGLEQRTGMTCIDLSAPHAGPDAILADRTLLGIGQRASAVVMTVPGAHQLSNPYYRVHRWRNDRVIAQNSRLRALYPEVEFDRHHFVRHLLQDLHDTSAGRFAVLRETLQRTWLTRMTTLVRTLDVPVTLLWMGERHPDEECDGICDGDPPFVTKEMIGALPVAARVEVVFKPRPFGGRRGRVISRRAVRRVPGQKAHDDAAERLAECLAGQKAQIPGAQRRSA